MSELRDIQGMLFLINLIIVVFVSIFVSILPIITRKSLLFGVRVPEAAGQSPEAIRMKRSYIATVITGGAAVTGLLVAQYLLLPDLSLLATLYFPLLLMALQYGAFIPRWKRTLALKAEKGWAVPATASAETRSAVEREKLLSFPKKWYWISLGILLVTAAVSLAMYPALPERIVTHWNGAMQPDAWGDKSLLTVLAMPLIALAVVLLMAASNIGIYRMKLQVDAENPALSFAQHRIYRKMMSGALGIVTAAITLFLAATQAMSLELFAPSATLMMSLTVALILICCLPFIYITVKAGQSGCKLRPSAEEQELYLKPGAAAPVRALRPARGDDRYWKLGLFYYNKEDPAFLVEDRFGTNGGMNYAHPAAKVVAIGFALLIVATYVIVTLMYFRYMR